MKSIFDDSPPPLTPSLILIPRLCSRLSHLCASIQRPSLVCDLFPCFSPSVRPSVWCTLFQLQSPTWTINPSLQPIPGPPSASKHTDTHSRWATLTLTVHSCHVHALHTCTASMHAYPNAQDARGATRSSVNLGLNHSDGASRFGSECEIKTNKVICGCANSELSQFCFQISNFFTGLPFSL